MTYRIGFRFEPRRGFYRAVVSVDSGIDLTPVFVDEGILYVLSPEPVHLGAFRSPKSVLESYLGARG